MTARIEVPPSYLAPLTGPDPTNPVWKAPGGVFDWIRASYGSVTEGPPDFVLVAGRPLWIGPRPAALAFTLRIPNPPPTVPPP